MHSERLVQLLQLKTNRAPLDDSELYERLGVRKLQLEGLDLDSMYDELACMDEEDRVQRMAAQGVKQVGGAANREELGGADEASSDEDIDWDLVAD